MSSLFLRNFRIVDADTDTVASVFIKDSVITQVIPSCSPNKTAPTSALDRVIEGWGGLCLMPSFVDLHAHLRDPGFLEKESLASGLLAAARGGFGVVVAMANTSPVTDTEEAALAVARRAGAIGLAEVCPVVSLSVGMKGAEVSGIKDMHHHIRGISDREAASAIRMVSEDGKDIGDDAVLKAAFREARRLCLPVSVHCDALGEEDRSVERAIMLGAAVGARVHIAHVSTRRTVCVIRDAKGRFFAPGELTAEVTPHHLTLTGADAERFGSSTHGKVAPPLRSADDREALLEALEDGTIDAIATDHAPHSAGDKEGGAPGFIGFETAFAAVHTYLSGRGFSLKDIARLMCASPAGILGFSQRGAVAPGFRADLVIVDPGETWEVDSADFASRSRNSPFIGKKFTGRVKTTIHGGRIVYDA